MMEPVSTSILHQLPSINPDRSPYWQRYQRHSWRHIWDDLINQFMLSQTSWWSLSATGWLQIRLLNTLRPRQNGRHFPDHIFKCIFLNENVWIWLKISLGFVPRVRINNIPALVQIWLIAVQATSHYLNQWWLVYWHMYASLGLKS